MKNKNSMERFINKTIKEQEEKGMIDTNNISDGQHTFGELYDHENKNKGVEYMSEADEMFDELGYKKKHDNRRRIVYKLFLGEIEFSLKNKYIFANFGIDMQELQAINKKCEELGWLDE